ncbi:hypothetical protein [Paenibacillus turpanensis]|uniref:hypothetical protein n=1 Tax=Paenibacillus turpanensis TaxID=2689078 RepID=UPI00140E3055|nr:hypothetical protein [Paenibacillus turpanensis]
MLNGDGIVLDVQEFAVLTALLDADMVIGLDDPYLGYLEEERQRAIEETQIRLLEQGIVVVHEDALDIEETHAVLTGVCAAARTLAVLRITGNQDKPLHESAFYFTQELVVECKKNMDSREAHYELVSMGPPYVCLAGIVDRWLGTGREQGGEAMPSLPLPCFEQLVRDQGPLSEETMQMLSQSVPAEGEREKLIELFSNKRGVLDFTVMTWNESRMGWSHSDIRFLLGQHDAYRIEAKTAQGGEVIMKLIPCGESEMIERLEQSVLKTLQN